MSGISSEGLTKPDLSIVILTYNRLNDIQKNLTYYCESFSKYEAEIIVVDNASTDGSRKFLMQLGNRYNQLQIISNDVNSGVAQGRNKGYRISTGKYILTLDDDTYLDIDGILGLVEHIASIENAGILTPVVLHGKTGSPQCYHGEIIREVANFHGACYMIKREVFHDIGFLDEECFFGGEELDYSMRARSAGYLTIYVPTIIAAHNNLIRAGCEGKERQAQWVFNYTRVLFKNLPLRIALLNAFRHLLGHLFHGSRESGIKHGITLLEAAYTGMRKGITAHKPLSKEAVSFYRRTDIRPEFGNVSIFVKLIKYLITNPIQI